MSVVIILCEIVECLDALLRIAGIESNDSNLLRLFFICL